MTTKPDPIRPTDDEARALARDLLSAARIAALAVQLPEGGPMVTRVAFGLSPEGTPLTLISDLAAHTRALRADPAASLLVGEPGSRGDPLTHPRLTLLARARFVAHDDPDYARLARHYLSTHPKAQLYIGFADFSFALFSVQKGLLNGGFGRAFHLTPADMGLAARD
ncbi:HugZ family pyridoxamine 5'-phosphate oxidase [Pseudodonghicola flavimaris]|uniref:Pyridoxamine 5'-phosphate oxidase family protein n=1 Tax=Pseudodonghicola flavimaris TaxID=3050036 RepID=A0ABT7F551_9RHOB|nr:pyridoxamine 5'-phosphate oxidase family protein [Pseudodonghicola flavimaris]MDK3019625.1 pyridoxamine 5'-phosphate oxidase family protein [Pseudodonghicola flavimaris]